MACRKVFVEGFQKVEELGETPASGERRSNWEKDKRG